MQETYITDHFTQKKVGICGYIEKHNSIDKNLVSGLGMHQQVTSLKTHTL
jgi:hypothetical protein